METKKVPPRCPYCAKSGTLEQEKSSQELLDEVAKDSREYDD
jgi:hypothetical protein